jgi:hypothetical protein
MTPIHTVCEEIGNWVNVAQIGIIWHKNVILLFKLQLFRNKFYTYGHIFYFVHIQMGDTHNVIQPVNIASAA